MILCTFRLPDERPDQQRAGVVKGDRVFELKKRATVMTIIGGGRGAGGVETVGHGHEVGQVRLGAPVQKPGKILATIVNTRGMLGGKDISLDRPRLDMKAPSTVVGPGERIRVPGGGVRPEVELAAVVGSRLSRATEAQARSAIFGYTVLNDVTAPADSREDVYEAYRRDRGTGEIRKTTLRGPLFRSKNHDAFCPMGPWIVTPDENADWSSLRMTTKFGDLLVQDGSTSEYIFTPAKIASYVSGFLTLEPGDVVSCGSVGWTKRALGNLDPTEYVLPLRSGTLALEIEGVGRLANPVTFRK
jgi:2-keto-4-pentenoate hydratase/2-oxohepta-3-ene-1,7-dioic acid hydratase in catechol pathway